LTILLIVDPREEARLELTGRILSIEPDAAIYDADGVARALKLMAGRRFDCIFAADILPEHPTLELLRALREGNDKTPFILLIDEFDKESVRAALIAGVDDCFCPLSPDPDYLALAARIRRFASDRLSNDRLASDNTTLAKDALHYRRIVETTSQGVWLIDGRGVTTYVNRRMADMLGYSVEEMVGRSVFRFMDQGWRDKALARYSDPATSEIQNYEFKYIRKDGTDLWASVTANPILSEKGRLKAGLAMVTDITEKRAAEAALRKSEDRYRQIVETTDEGVWLINRHGVTTFVNQRMADMLGYTVDEMLGKQVFRFTDREWRDWALERYGDYNDTEKHTYEYKYYRKDGSELWAQVTANPILEENGRIVGGLAMVTDITEKLEAEKAIRESEARFRQMAESVEEAFFLRTRDRMLYISPSYEKIFGRSCESLLENPDSYLETIHPDDRDRILEAIRAEREEAVKFKEEFRVVWPNGEVRWIKVLSYIVDRSGGEHRTAGVVEDITERVLRDEELRRSRGKLEEQTRLLAATNQELEAFAYTVSHDLQAPLRRINGWIKLIMLDLSQSVDEELLGYIRLVDSNSREMRQLVDVLLDFSRMMRKELVRGDVDLGGLAHKLVDELRHEQPQRKLKLSIAAGLHCTGDAQLLSVVMGNLISNAWKYTSREKIAEIEIGALEQEDRTVFYVRDNGVGFNPAHAERMFMPFQRLHTEEEFKGLGIGLATVQRIIHRHDGRIWAESRPGEGATFYFTIN
jgi:PAS domain S-box-containing protein